MLIRAERVDDIEDIANVTADAFARPGESTATEVGLVAALRASGAWIPQLSLVALIDDAVVGHCLSTRADVDGFPVLALGPISVATAHQRRGVGSVLVRSTLDIAEDMSEALIGLLGDPGFYARFGFVPGSTEDVDPPEPSWGRHFQVRRLSSKSRPTGLFSYPRPFQVVG